MTPQPSSKVSVPMPFPHSFCHKPWFSSGRERGHQSASLWEPWRHAITQSPTTLHRRCWSLLHCQMKALWQTRNSHASSLTTTREANKIGRQEKISSFMDKHTERARHGGALLWFKNLAGEWGVGWGQTDLCKFEVSLVYIWSLSQPRLHSKILLLNK